MEMESLNQIVSDNAKIALAAAIERGDTDGTKLNAFRIARKIAKLMGKDVEQEKEVQNTRRSLDSLLAAKQKWHTEWIEAFCAAVGESPERLVLPDYASRPARATNAWFLILKLGQQLERPQTRKIGEVFLALLERPRLFTLFLSIFEIMIKAKTREEADVRVSEQIRRSRAWQTPQEDDRSAHGS
jgi:hypothetical protein